MKNYRVRFLCNLIVPLLILVNFFYFSFRTTSYYFQCHEPHKFIDYPILFDNWTNGFDSQYVAFNPPDFHPDNRRTLLPHPAKTSKRWLTSFAHGYYASNFQYFISEPFPEHTCRDNPPITMMYYNVHEACDLLSRFGTVTLIGDSFTRHVWLALLHILTNNKRNGHLSKSSLSNPNHILCNYDEAYSERACRQLVANALDELHAPLCPNINGTYSMKYFDLATHPTQSHFYIVPDSLKPSLIIQANGAHDLGNEALRFPADTQKTYKDAQLYMVQQVRNQSQIMIYPLFLTPHNLITSESAPYRSHWNSVAKRRVHTFAPLMSDFFNQIGSDSKIIRPFPNKLDSTEDFFQLHLSKTNELVDEQHVHPWSILEMDRMSTNLPFNMSFDGHHYSSFVNTIKAQAILNFMHTILTELNI